MLLYFAGAQKHRMLTLKNQRSPVQNMDRLPQFSDQKNLHYDDPGNPYAGGILNTNLSYWSSLNWGFLLTF